MIIVHHLETSRSHRVLWMLEELGAPYEMRRYSRDPVTRLAPPELKAIHPLGKSPVIVDDGATVAESGAIIEYLVERHGQGRFRPPVGTPEWLRYIHWMHFAEGSAMLPLMLQLYTMRLGDAAAPVRPRIASEIDNHFSYVNGELTGRDYLCGSAFTAADVQLSFVLEAAHAFGALGAYPALGAYLTRLQARPAYQTAIEKGGPVVLKMG